MKLRSAPSVCAVFFGVLFSSSLAFGQVKISSIAPATVQPGSTLTFNGASVPAGVSAANVTATFAPVTSGAGPTVTAPLANFQAVVGTTYRFTVTIPSTLSVTSPTSYHVSVSATASPAFTTTTPGTLTVNPSHALSSVTPATGELTQTLNIAIAGSFTNFVQGVSTASFGPGITVNSLTVNSATSATANVTISPTAMLGATSVSVTEGSQTDTLPAGFTILAAPTVTAASPNTGNLGQTLNVTLTGSGTTWLNGSGALGASFGAGITVNSISATSDTSASANITVSGTATVGARTVTVTKGTETATGAGIFSVAANPAITGVSPISGAQGQTLNVTISGTNAGWTGSTTVAFLGSGITVNNVTLNNSNSLTANITIDPVAAPLGLRTVTTTTGTTVLTAGSVFNVTAGSAAISSLSPNSAQQGASPAITITGTGTHFSQSSSTVTFSNPGITVGTVTVNSPTSLTINIAVSPSAATGAGNVSVTTQNEVATSTGGFTVNAGTPVLSSVNPNSGAQGATLSSVSLSGSFTHWVQGTTTATFGAGISVNSLTVNSANSATASITINPTATIGSNNVTLTTNGEIVTLTNGFTITAGPAAISSIVAGSGQQGQSLTVTVTGTNTHFAQGVTSANFGAGITVGSVSVNSQTSAQVQLTIASGATIGARNVTLTTSGENASLTSGFTVTAGTPVITSITPGSGAQGQASLNVVIAAAFTHFSGGVTTANFGSGITVNSVSVTDATDATVNITIAGTAMTGSRSVSLTTGGETVSTSFTVSSGSATILSLTPSTGQQGQTISSLAIVGSGTNFLQGTSLFSLGSGITISSLTVNSPTSATASIAISPTATVGNAYTATMTTGGEVASLNNAFTVTAATPVITSISPNSLAQGATSNITVTGQYTSFSALSTANFGAGVTVNSVTYNSPTSLTVNVTVSPTATLSTTNNVTITTGSQVVTLTAGFSITAGPAVLLSLNPNNAAQGASTVSVAIVGQSTNFSQTNSVVSFGSGITVNSLTVNSPTSATAVITVSATATPGTRTVTVTTAGENASLSNGFTVNAGTPVITSVTPNSGAQQQSNLSVTVLGNFTHFSAGITTASFGAGITVNGVTVNNATSASVSITITPTAATGNRNVTMTTNSEVVTLTNGFTVTAGPAAISSLNPNNGPQGANNLSVAIVGANTNFVNATTTVSFGQNITVTAVIVTDATHASAIINISSTATPGPVSVTATTGGENATIVNGFTVNAATPVISLVNPATGAQGATITSVAITGQFTHFVQGTSVATFGPNITVNSTSVTDATHATANITISPTASLGLQNVSVTTGTETANGSSLFNITAGPAAISSLNPASGTQGQSSFNVAIVGSATHFTNGQTSASFGGGATVNTLMLTDATHATANITIPAATTPGTYTVTLTTGGESAAIANGFTVNAGAPVITSVNPPSGIQGQTIASIAIVGNFTHFVQGTTTVNFGTGITTTLVTVTDSTHLTASITISATAPTGSRTVTANTGQEAAPIASGFTVNAGNAAITAVNPSGGQQGVTGLSVGITGSATNFAQGTSVLTFGGGYITVTSLTINSATSATALITIPAAAPTGPVSVTMTTAGEVATLANGFTVTAGSPVISSISPNTAHQGDPPFNIAVVANFTTFVQGTTTASFGVNSGITVNTVTVTDSTHATLNVTVSTTAPPGISTLTITTGTQVATLPNAFTVIAGVPSLASVNPAMGSQGASLTVQLNGAFTHFTQGTTTVNFGNGITAGTVTVNGPTVASVPINISSGTAAGPRSVTVTTGTEVVTLSGGFTVQAGTPAITLISPNFGVPNSSVTVSLTGQFTGWVNGTTVASFGPNISVGGATAGAAGPITVTSNTTATASLTIAPGATLQGQNVVVTTGTEVEMVVNGFTVQNNSTTPPTIISITPGSATTGAPLNTAVTVQWSEPMNRASFTSSSFFLYDNTTGQYPIPATITLDASGRISTITPSQLLAVDRQYTIYLNNSGNNIQDALGNNFGGTTSYFYTGFSTSSTGPAFITSNIPPSATGVPLNAPVVLQFSSAINPATQAAGVQITTGGNTVTGTYTFDSTQTILTFVPNPALTASTTYNVAYGIQLTDDAGNALTNPGSFSFTTGTAADTNGPAISSTDPPANATGVGTNAILRVVFTKPIDPTTLSTANFILYNANNTNVTYPGTVAVSADHMSATFTPTSPMLPLTVFVWQVSGYKGENGVNDTQNVSQFFTTGSASDTTPPTVTAVSPVSGATGVPVNTQISAQFSKVIDATSLTNTSISLSPAAAGTATLSGNQLSVTFVPSSSLAPSTTYTISISGLRDMDGNTLSPFTPTTFTTSSSSMPDTTRPSVTSFLPASGATNVPLNSTITINVNAPINPISVTTDTNNSTDSIAVFMTPNGGTQVQVGGTFTVTNTSSASQIVFTPSVPFEPNSSVSVYAVYNVYPTDYAGNNLNNASESFTTVSGADTTAPVVTSVTPPNGATTVGENTPVILTFSKPLNPATINSSNFALFVGSTSIGTSVTHSADSRTVTLTGSLPSGAIVNVVATSGVTDLVGNALANFSSTFTAEVLPSTTRPYVVTMRPGSGATAVPATSPVTLITSSPMNPSTISSALNVSQNGVLVSGTTTLDSTGQSILFTPAAPFTSGALVQVFLSSAATDTSGNPLQNFTGQFTVATSLTGVAPTIVAISPAYTTTINVLNPVIDVQFSKPINLATVTNSTFYVQENDQTSIPGTLSLINPYTIHFVPNAPLSSAASGPYYRINMTSGIQDTTGLAFAGSVGFYYFYFATTATLVDTVAPTVTGLAPTSGSTVGDNTIFRATFSKPVDPLTVTSSTFMVSGGGLTVMPSSISFDSTNQNVTITPQAPLPDNALMTIAINGITDISGNPVTPLTSQFTTLNGADTTQPTVVSTNVVSGEANVPINSAIVFQFSKAMDSRTLNGTNFYVYDNAFSVYIPVTYSYSADGLSATMTPVSLLPVGRSIQIGARNTDDLAGNQIVNFAISFTTAFASSTTRPTVSDTSPRNGATGIPTNAKIQVLFSEPIEPTVLGGVQLLQGSTPVTATPSLSTANNILTLTPATLLLPGTQYTLSISGVTDAAGNVLAAPVTATFTTGPGVLLSGPTITSFSPASNETGVPTNAELQVSFNERIDQLSLTGANFLLYNYAQSRYLPATVTVNPNLLTATLVPTAALAPGNAYQISVSGNSYTDLAGNLGNGGSVTFYTASGPTGTSPTVTSISPANNATGVGLNAIITAKLSAPLDPVTIGNGSITLTPAVAGTVSLGADQETLTFTPTGTLAASTPYTIQVSGFTDLAGHAVTAFNSAFTTGTATITTGPSVTSTLPAASSTAVPLNSTITININSQINPASVVTDTNSTSQTDSIAVFATVAAGQFYVGGAVAVTNNNTSNTSQVVFTPTNPLPPNATITVYIVYNAYITDFEGNRIANSSFSFTTGSGTVTPPTVLSVTPTNGATGVGPYTTVALTMSAPLNPNTINANSFALFNGTSNINASIGRSSDNKTVLLSYSNLPGNSLITVTATSQATDYEGNALTPFTSSFTTAPTPTNSSPSIISQRPANGATGVATNTTIYLISNKVMNASTLPGAVHVSLNGVIVPGTVTLNPAGTSILFTPSAPFTAGGGVQIVVDSSATDSDGNALNAYSGTFTVLPSQTGVAPTFVAMNPPYTSDNQPLNSVVDVEFSKPMAASSVTSANIYLNENDVNVVPATVELLFPNVIRIIPNSTFVAGHNFYRLDMPANGLTDTNGNFFAGSVGVYYFYTEPTSIVDTTRPTVTGLAPTNGAASIGDNAVIQVAFSKVVDPLTVNGTTVSVTGGNATVMPSTIAFDSSGQIATITPLAPLPDNTTMTIAISGVTDNSGNTVVPQTTTFTTGPGANTTAPSVIASSVDGNDNTNVPQNSVFTVKFSAPMNTLGLLVPTNFYLYDNTTGQYLATNRSFSSDGTIAYINSTSPLPAGHSVQLGARTATDLTGNPLNGFAIDFTVSATTDTVPPTVTATNPGGAVNPPTNSVIQVLFNKSVQATSLSQVTLTAGGPAIPVNATLSQGDTLLTLTPNAPLAPNTSYTVTVTGVQSLAGVAIATPYIFNFTTGAGAQLTGTAAISTVPAPGSTGVSDTVTPTVTFSAPIDPISAYGNVSLVVTGTGIPVPSTLSFSTDFTTVTITPNAPLISGTQYSIQTNGAVTDQTGQRQSANVNNSFTAQ